MDTSTSLIVMTSSVIVSKICEKNALLADGKFEKNFILFWLFLGSMGVWLTEFDEFELFLMIAVLYVDLDLLRTQIVRNSRYSIQLFVENKKFGLKIIVTNQQEYICAPLMLPLLHK